jgi:hypothetical protein
MYKKYDFVYICIYSHSHKMGWSRKERDEAMAAYSEHRVRNNFLIASNTTTKDKCNSLALELTRRYWNPKVRGYFPYYTCSVCKSENRGHGNGDRKPRKCQSTWCKTERKGNDEKCNTHYNLCKKIVGKFPYRDQEISCKMFSDTKEIKRLLTIDYIFPTTKKHSRVICSLRSLQQKLKECLFKKYKHEPEVKVFTHALEQAMIEREFGYERDDFIAHTNDCLEEVLCELVGAEAEAETETEAEAEE